MSQHNDLQEPYSVSEHHPGDGLMFASQARAEQRIPELPLWIEHRAQQHDPVLTHDPDFSRIVLEASADCIAVLSLDGLLLFMNEHGRCLMEVNDLSQMKGESWLEVWSRDQRPAVQRAIKAARSGGVGRFVGCRSTANGRPKWWDVVVSPKRDARGTPTHLVAVSRDVTTAKHYAEAGTLLNLELGHRIKNLFALVNGLITLAARADPVAQPFATTLRERITALSGALIYVLPPKELAVARAPTLQGLLRVLLDPYEDYLQRQRFVILGDDPRVGPRATTSLALTLHELATNAVKHGALASPDGHVTITCRCNPDGDGELAWIERGGLTITRQPERTGFGSKLLLRSVAALGGHVTRRWDREGLTLRLVLPLASLSL
jgi:PAS domain S-box-containing protein